jgi:ParB family chromosome partitioning protein
MPSITKADTVFVPIALIEVGERRRKKVGDLRVLKASIEEHGLFHPILLRDETELVAGQRRLEACRALGWTKIPARDAGKLSEDDLRAIELEENEARIPLTPGERTRQRLAEIEKAAKREREKPAQASAQVSGKRGPARTPGSGRSRAAAAGLALVAVLRSYKVASQKPEAAQEPFLALGTPPRPLDRLSLRKRLWRACDAAGLPRRGGLGWLRHEAATLLRERGESLQRVGQGMGHTSARVVQAHYDESDRRAAEEWRTRKELGARLDRLVPVAKWRGKT